MINIIVMLLGFFLTEGNLGAELIGATNYLHIYLGAILVLVGFIFILVTLAFLLDKSEYIKTKLVTISLSIFGLSIMLLKTIFMFFLAGWLMTNIDPNIMTFNELDTKEIVGLITLVVIPFIFRVR